MTNTSEILKPIYLAEMSFDDGDFDLHQSVLMNDFSFKSPFGSFNTVPDYMTWLKSFYEVVKNQGGTRHLITNPVITQISSTQVHVKSYLTILNKKTMNIIGTSVVADTLTQHDNIWKCSHREIFTDQTFN